MGRLLNKPKRLCEDHYLIGIDMGSDVSSPGQFVNIRLTHQTDPLLRRPFSIHNHEKNTIEVVFRVVGKGTKILRNLNKGTEIDVLAPLGKGFSIITNGRALLIGGGVGNAPLYYLAKKLKEQNTHVSYIYGARSKNYVYLKKRYTSVSDLFILSTDDGSEGRRGLVPDITNDIIHRNNFDYIYICGPSIMMEKTLDLLNDILIPIEISVENYFGCGIGLCYGCAVEGINGMKRACIDGPVFNSREIHLASIK